LVPPGPLMIIAASSRFKSVTGPTRVTDFAY
jgi:hypothetical protein